jgi:hypothetical protein
MTATLLMFVAVSAMTRSRFLFDEIVTVRC